MDLFQASESRPRIAVAGATGRVGSALMASLAADAVDLIALSRKPDPARFSASVAHATVNFDDPATLRKALEGADRLFLAQGTSARQADNEIALIDAALVAGVRHIVKLSVYGPPTRLHPFDWHRRVETHLSTQQIGWTLLQPTTFMDILARAGQPVIAGCWGGAAGQGRVNMIDTRDVAVCARAVLLDPQSTDWQRTYHLTGPRAWTMADIAEEMSRCFGRTVRYHHRSPADQRAFLIKSGLSEFVADLLVGLDQTVSESMLTETTSTVEMLTGQSPRTLPHWLAQNAALFGR